jgi:hypothetical protein
MSQAHFQQYFSYIVAVNFVEGGNRKKPPTCRKSLTNFFTMLYQAHLAINGILWASKKITKPTRPHRSAHKILLTTNFHLPTTPLILKIV